jgi:hypothetical protein
LLGVLLLGACQAVPGGIVDNTNGPRRGSPPPGYQDQPDATMPDPSPGPDAAVDDSDAGKPEKNEPPPVVDANPHVDLVPVVEPKPAVEAGPPVDAQDTGGGQLFCRAPGPGEIDLWLPGAGNCSYPVGELPQYVAAVDRDLYAAGTACGSCLEVSSNRGKVIATVVDQYPVSPSPRGNKISLNSAALAVVAAPGTSVASMRWRWVPCPASGPIVGALKEGSHFFYWEVMIRNAVNHVAKVEFITATDRTWRPTKQEAYGYFSHGSSSGLPLQLRLTDTDGLVLTTGDLAWAANVTAPLPLGVQFTPACTP